MLQWYFVGSVPHIRGEANGKRQRASGGHNVAAVPPLRPAFSVESMAGLGVLNSVVYLHNCIQFQSHHTVAASHSGLGTARSPRFTRSTRSKPSTSWRASSAASSTGTCTSQAACTPSTTLHCDRYQKRAISDGENLSIRRPLC